jgi:DNA-binding Lrp family transcriptional regulator
MDRLDLKDKRILTILNTNARTPLSKVASQVGLSKQVVDYRIKNLAKRGIITGFTIYCDLTKLGYSTYGVYLRLRNITEKKEKEIIDLLVKHPFTRQVTVCEGKWDLTFTIVARSTKEFSSKLEEIIADIGDDIERYETTNFFTVHEFYLNLLGKEELNSTKPPRDEFTTHTGLEKIDEIDVKILQELKKNSRISPVVIAGKLKVSADTVRYRMKSLVDRKIINEFHAQINFKPLGYGTFLLILDLKRCSDEHEKELLMKIKQIPYLTSVVRCMGGWDFELSIKATNNEEFRKTLMKTREKLGELTTTYHTVIVFSNPKDDSFPDGVAQELIKEAKEK